MGSPTNRDVSKEPRYAGRPSNRRTLQELPPGEARALLTGPKIVRSPNQERAQIARSRIEAAKAAKG